MLLVCKKTSLDLIEAGQEVAFTYSNAKANGPERVGVVDGWVSRDCFRMWDFSLLGGPGWRSYRVEYVSDLAVIVPTTATELFQIEQNAAYKANLARYMRRLTDHGQ